FTHPSTTEIYTLSLHDALPISEFETIKSLYKEKSQNIKLGDTLNELSKSTQKFDLILSCPPFGMRTQHINGEKSPFDFATTLLLDRKSTRLNSSHVKISYAVFC